MVPEQPPYCLASAADPAAAPPKKQKRESRILRAAKRELEAERSGVQSDAPSAPTGSQAAPGEPSQKDAMQAEAAASAAQGQQIRKEKTPKAKIPQKATGLQPEVPQNSAPQRNGKAKPGRKQAQHAVSSEADKALGAAEEQPPKKQVKQGKQKGKKSKGPDPSTGKLLEGAIAMLAARALKHVKR